MKYQVTIVASVQKQLDKLPNRTATRIIDKLAALGDEPRPHQCKKLVGYDNEYRIRIGSYRAIYEIKDSELIVLVLKVGHRKDIYT